MEKIQTSKDPPLRPQPSPSTPLPTTSSPPTRPSRSTRTSRRSRRDWDSLGWERRRGSRGLEFESSRARRWAGRVVVKLGMECGRDRGSVVREEEE